MFKNCFVFVQLKHYKNSVAFPVALVMWCAGSGAFSPFCNAPLAILAAAWLHGDLVEDPEQMKQVEHVYQYETMALKRRHQVRLGM